MANQNPNPQQTAKILQYGCMLAIGLFLFIFFGLQILRSCSSPQQSPQQQQANPNAGRPEGAIKRALWYGIQNAIKPQLKDPTSAVFPDYQDEFFKSLGGNKYAVSATVLATNSFGAKVQTKFTLIAEDTGTEARFTSIMIGQ